ncbi:Flp family type IVb pilin [Sinomonas humi]|nr:Flp family type IVb pilin [Sinomonas humi]
MDEEKERGASSVEYSLLVTLIAVAVFGAVTLVGPALLPGFNSAIAGFTP